MHVNMRCVAQVKKEKEKKSVSIQTILGLFVLAWAVMKETPDTVCYKFTAIWAPKKKQKAIHKLPFFLDDFFFFRPIA